MGGKRARELTIYGHTFKNVRKTFWQVMALCVQYDLPLDDVDVPELFRWTLEGPIMAVEVYPHRRSIVYPRQGVMAGGLSPPLS